MATFNSLILKALEIGDITEISTLLNSPDVNLEAFDSEGDTILHQIIKNERLSEEKIVDILQIFLDHGIDPNVKNKYWKTILDLAVDKKMRDVIVLLRKYNGESETHCTRIEYENFWKMADTDEDSILRRREIMEKESASYVEWLILKGINFNSESIITMRGCNYRKTSRNNVLISAISNSLLHILPVFLKYTKVGNNGREDGQTLLHDIFRIKNEHCKSVISADWYVNYRQRYIPTILKMLIDRGCSVVAADKAGLTPLRAALERGEDDSIIEILVNHVPDGCDKNSLALSIFCEMVIGQWSDLKVDFYLKILDDLIARGVEINGKNKSGDSPIHCAVRAKNFAAFDYLKEKGVDFNILTDNNDNLLHILAEKTVGKNYSQKIDEVLFDFFVEKGCQVNGTNTIGNSPLHIAAMYGNLTIARKLIAYGASVDYRNSKMQTPLHLGTTHEDATKIVEFLIDEGAKVNSRDVQGCTPLHYAVSSFYESSVKVLKILLQNGAYLDAEDNKGESPLAKALLKYNYGNFQELLKHGANFNNPATFSCVANGNANFSVPEHWQKLRVAGLPCLEDLKEYFKIFDGIFTNFYKECLKEVETLKGTSIGSLTSLYDFLHMNSDSRYIHVHNEKLKNIVDCPEIKIRFPNYSVLILGSYREAVARKALMKSAKEAWLTLTEICLPEICIDRIFHFLNDVDLMTIIDEN